NGVLLPVAASTSRCWVNPRSWDRTTIPKFGAQIHVLVGEPMDVPQQLDATQLEDLRVSLEQRLLRMHTELDARIGFGDSQPLQARPDVPVGSGLPVAGAT